jgi:hypothetical protein
VPKAVAVKVGGWSVSDYGAFERQRRPRLAQDQPGNSVITVERATVSPLAGNALFIAGDISEEIQRSTRYSCST